jgi:hypothetical protein
MLPCTANFCLLCCLLSQLLPFTITTHAFAVWRPHATLKRSRNCALLDTCADRWRTVGLLYVHFQTADWISTIFQSCSTTTTSAMSYAWNILNLLNGLTIAKPQWKLVNFFLPLIKSFSDKLLKEFLTFLLVIVIVKIGETFLHIFTLLQLVSDKLWK